MGQADQVVTEGFHDHCAITRRTGAADGVEGLRVGGAAPGQQEYAVVRGWHGFAGAVHDDLAEQVVQATGIGDQVEGVPAESVQDPAQRPVVGIRGRFDGHDKGRRRN